MTDDARKTGTGLRGWQGGLPTDASAAEHLALASPVAGQARRKALLRAAGNDPKGRSR